MCQRSSEEWTHSIARPVDTHQGPGQTCKQRSALRQNVETRLELSFGFLNLIDAQKSKPVAESRARILRLDPDGVLMECQCVLPDVIVRDAKHGGYRHETCGDKAAGTLILNGRPGHACDQGETENRRVKKPLCHEQGNRHDPVRHRQKRDEEEQNAETHCRLPLRKNSSGHKACGHKREAKPCVPAAKIRNRYGIEVVVSAYLGGRKQEPK